MSDQAHLTKQEAFFCFCGPCTQVLEKVAQLCSAMEDPPLICRRISLETDYTKLDWESTYSAAESLRGSLD